MEKTRAGLGLVDFVCSLKGICNHALELLPDVFSQEIAEVEYRSVVFLGEPRPSLADFAATDVAGVAAGRFTPHAIVLPKSVFKERLREGNLEEASVCFDGECERRAKEQAGINDFK